MPTATRTAAVISPGDKPVADRGAARAIPLGMTARGAQHELQLREARSTEFMKISAAEASPLHSEPPKSRPDSEAPRM